MWVEAKNAGFWGKNKGFDKRMVKFKNQIGKELKVAGENGADLEVHTTGKVPQEIMDWLSKKGVGVVLH